MTDLIFFLGLAAITAGVAFIYWPAGLIVGGLLAASASLASANARG